MRVKLVRLARYFRGVIQLEGADNGAGTFGWRNDLPVEIIIVGVTTIFVALRR